MPRRAAALCRGLYYTGTMTGEDQVVRWLLAGDPSIRWQVMRDLAGAAEAEVEAERARVSLKGWGRQVLAQQAADGRWGGGLYSPKWTSTTYTLLLLRWLGLARDDRRARTGTLLLLDAGLYRDNGINLWQPRTKCSETCVTGMVLGLAARFAAGDGRLERLAGHLLEQQMADGGWNCLRPRGATHSSHTQFAPHHHQRSGGAARIRTRWGQSRRRDSSGTRAGARVLVPAPDVPVASDRRGDRWPDDPFRIPAAVVLRHFAWAGLPAVRQSPMRFAGG